jgi:hypothetical protein
MVSIHHKNWDKDNAYSITYYPSSLKIIRPPGQTGVSEASFGRTHSPAFLPTPSDSDVSIPRRSSVARPEFCRSAT